MSDPQSAASYLDEIARLTGERGRQYDQNCEQIIRIAALEARVKELEGGLRFYAAWPRTPSGNMAALLLDAGHKARALLTQSALKGVHTEHTPAPEKGGE